MRNYSRGKSERIEKESSSSYIDLARDGVRLSFRTIQYCDI